MHDIGQSSGSCALRPQYASLSSFCEFIFYVLLTVAKVGSTKRFQPETLQLIADRGQHNVPILYKPVLPVIGRNSPAVPSTATRPKVSRNPFRLFLNPDVDVLLLIAAISCAIFYGVIATISTSFAEAYPFLTQTTIGLCFLSIGGGMMFGSSVSGRVFDRQYAKYKAKAQAQMSADPTADMTREESFPLEKVWIMFIKVNTQLIAAVTQGSTSPDTIPHHTSSYRMCGVWMEHPEESEYCRPSDFAFY